MQRSSSSRAFTIIELLVVVSIIALLVGILLPAIGKARDQAQLTRSQANIKQISTATATYAAEWSDRQPTFIDDNISTYGTSPAAAFQAYFDAHSGKDHPWIWLGYGSNGGAPVVWGYAPPPTSARTSVFQPIDFVGGPAPNELRMGSFRLVQVRAVNTYVNGRFYDPVFYAPKDTAVINSVENIFDNQNEFVSLGNGVPIRLSSYCFSAAAMFSPDVLSEASNGKFYTNPWILKGGFRSPSMGQATYPNLKTHILEHHWLQNKKRPCNPNFNGGIYEGCQPYMFNHAFNSQPVTAFFDGHIEQMGQEINLTANARMVEQTGDSNHGLWSLDTSYGPGGSYSYDTPMGGGYWMSQGQDWTSTSYHVLTIDGIKGRDKLPN